MTPVKLIADSGSTKAEWCLTDGLKQEMFVTEGLSPYFLNALEIEEILRVCLSAIK